MANNTTIGDNIFVEDLDDDEFNEYFDQGAFVYDKSRTGGRAQPFGVGPELSRLRPVPGGFVNTVNTCWRMRVDEMMELDQ